MDLYQELILEHSKRPRRSGLRDPFDAEVHHVNPTCGDEVTLRVELSGEGADTVVRDVSYRAQGCSISVLRLDDEMTELWDAPVDTPALRWGM